MFWFSLWRLRLSETFWGTFTKWRKATTNSDMSVRLCDRPPVRPSAWNNSATTVRIFMQFDIWLSRNTNKIQLVIEFIIPTFNEGSTFFRGAHLSSSGALKLYLLPLVYIPMWWPAVVKAEWDNGRSPHGYINQRLKIQFRAPDDEWCAPRNMLSFQ